MRHLGISRAVQGKGIVTTVQDKSAGRAPCLVDRDYRPCIENRIRAGNIRLFSLAACLETQPSARTTTRQVRRLIVRSLISPPAVAEFHPDLLVALRQAATDPQHNDVTSYVNSRHPRSAVSKSESRR